MSHDWRVWLLNIATVATAGASLLGSINPAWGEAAGVIAAVGNSILHTIHVNESKAAG